ncbi:MAG: hypothetical protein M3P08_01200 [Thermoproteota archaeon]|nr:hypothetical protein [Thermoproteota archaeon]
MLINRYSFNNTINSNPTEQGPPPPQDMRNRSFRNQIVNENQPGNRVYTVNDMAYGYTWKRGDPLIVGHLVRIH